MNWLGPHPAPTIKEQLLPKDLLTCLKHFDFPPELVQWSSLREESFIITQLVQFLLMYGMLFILPTKYAVFAGCFGTIAYTSVLGGFHSYMMLPAAQDHFVRHLCTDLVIMLLAVGVAAAAKRFIEQSKFEIFALAEAQKVQVVTEKVLRCQ